jgi:hypothetical protein
MDSSILRRCSEIPTSPEALRRDHHLPPLKAPRPFSTFLNKQHSTSSLTLFDLQLATAEQSAGHAWSSRRANPKDRPTSPRTVQKELEILLSSTGAPAKPTKGKRSTKKPDPLSSLSDHTRSTSRGGKKSYTIKSREADDDLSQASCRSHSSHRKSSKSSDTTASLSSSSDRPSKARSLKKVDSIRDLNPAPRSRGMWDSFSRLSVHIRPSPSSAASADHKTDAMSTSDHGPAATRRKSGRVNSSYPPSHFITATPKRRVRFEMNEIDYFEYDGATEEEKEDFVTSKVDSKRGRQEAVAECKLYSETNQDWVRGIEFLHASPLKSSLSHASSTLTKDEALRAISESEARGLEFKCSQLLSRHQKWAVSSVLARQVQLKLEHPSTVDHRWEQLRARISSVSQCSADFARLLAEVDAKIAHAIYHE